MFRIDSHVQNVFRYFKSDHKLHLEHINELHTGCGQLELRRRNDSFCVSLSPTAPSLWHSNLTELAGRGSLSWPSLEWPARGLDFKFTLHTREDEEEEEEKPSTSIGQQIFMVSSALDRFHVLFHSSLGSAAHSKALSVDVVSACAHIKHLKQHKLHFISVYRYSNFTGISSRAELMFVFMLIIREHGANRRS